MPPKKSAEETTTEEATTAIGNLNLADRPSVLVLGGVGMIGRNFVKYLVDNQLASFIRVADKSMPQTSYFSEEHRAAFASSLVEYKQANLIRDNFLDKVFDRPFTYVVNCAAETRFGQSAEVYRDMCEVLSTKCAAKAATVAGLQKYIEISTAQVYKSQGRRACAESAPIEPWTEQARAKLRAEQAVLATRGLPALVVRPALVYGPADVTAIMPRIVTAATYVQMGEKMQFLWDADMRINTVHVVDVCAALWHLLQHGQPGAVFNLADKNDTSQGSMNSILAEVFGIRTGFAGSIISNLARLNLREVVSSANEKHLLPWSDLLREHGVTNTPLTPYIDQDLMSHNHTFVDGSAIEATGFAYARPRMATDDVRQLVQQYMDQGLFPRMPLPGFRLMPPAPPAPAPAAAVAAAATTVSAEGSGAE